MPASCTSCLTRRKSGSGNLQTQKGSDQKMSLIKRCSPDAPAILVDGTPNPFHCRQSPKCHHFWHYDFRVNRQRYRATTETWDKHQARDIEAKERSRILEGKHGIRRQPDITFKAFAK